MTRLKLTPGPNIISWDCPKLRQLKKEIAKCPDGDTFMFQGNEVRKDYAVYLAQFLDGLKKQGRLPK